MKKLVLAVLMSLLAVVCLAQTQPSFENGWKPYGSYDGTRIDTVNLMNGNLMLHAPIIPDIPQRGSVGLSYALYVSSKDWQAVCAPNPAYSGSVITCAWKRGGTGVNVQVSPGFVVHRTLNKQYTNSEGTTIFAAYGYSLTSADGATHQLHGVAGSEDANGEPTKFDSIDLSGYHLEMSVPSAPYGVLGTFTITDRNGNKYQGIIDATAPCGRPQINRLPNLTGYAPVVDDSPMGDQYCSQYGSAASVTDQNGNQMQLPTPAAAIPTPTPAVPSGIAIDTLGRQMPPAGTTTITTDTTGCVSPLPITSVALFPYQAPDGTIRQAKFCSSQFPIHTSFGQMEYGYPISEFDSTLLTTPPSQVASVILADGTKWTFNYDNFGELTYVGLPTGGSITYTWKMISFSNCDVTNTTPVSRAVATRTLNDGQGHTAQWLYSWGASTSAGATNTVTDPLGNDTVHVFSPQAPPGGTGTAGCNLYETSTIHYQGSVAANHPLQRVDTTYSSAAVGIDDIYGGASEVGNIFATDIVTTLYTNGTATKVKKVHNDPDPGLGTNLPIFGNVIKELDYDWGQGGPGPLLRETDTVYQWQKNSSYLTAHIVDLPASTVVIDPVAASNTKSGCPINAAGGTASCIAETDSFYDEAAYLTATSINTQHVPPPAAVRGNLTTLSHWLNTANSFVSSHTNWYDTGEPYQKIDPLGHTTTLSYDSAYVGAYVTQTCSPATNAGTVAHCVIGAYDFNTGVLTSFTDQNGQTSNYGYDLMFRITSAQAPVDQANNNARATTNLSYSTTSLPWSVTRTRSITDAPTDPVTSMFDGLGRGNKSQHPMPGGTATVDTVYDPAGRVASVTNPYFSASDPTYGVTQNIYDALDRPLLVQKQDGSFSTVTYQDNCTLAEDEAGKARRTCADALGRLYEVEEPGDSTAPAATDTSTVSTQATAVVSIGGSEQVVVIPAPPCPPRQICDQTPDTVYDSGTVSVTVSGHTTSATYQQGDTASSVALHLANAINADGAAVVTASASGTQITLTAKTAGEAGDYTATYSTAWDTADFSGASFSGLVSNLRLLGGADLNQFAHTYLTLYFYDALSNLLCVEQHGNVAPGTSGATGCSAAPSNDAGSPWRVRRFTYDSHSRLLTAKNPESGTISYAYDNDGELLMKTSPAPNQTGSATQTVSYCYDELHRVTKRDYAAHTYAPPACPITAPVVSYGYDTGTNAIGKLTSLTDQAGTATYVYDALGRRTGETRVISGVSKSLSYGYNLDGSLKTLTYPSGRVVTYTPDSAGRPVSAVDSNGTNYVTAASYNAANSLTSLVNGNSTSFAGITNSFLYNPRLQLCRITAYSSGSVPGSCADAANHGNLMDRGYNYNLGVADNGNVLGITNYRDTTRSQSFTYDPLNRLTSGWSAANTGAMSWGETYSIDPWGNLQIAPMANKAHGGYLPNASDVSNRPIGMGYDAAGNMTNYTAPGQYVYDQENRLLSTGGMSYAYDASGDRVLKSDTSTGAAVKRYWSSAGNIVAEADGSGSLTAEYIYFGGRRVARIDLPANSAHYYLSDHLSSTSVVASAAGTIEDESDYYPFGTEVVVAGPGTNKYKFIGKERDSESQLDLMGARYYSNALGRFLQADPLYIHINRLADPQQLGLYSYVRNGPITLSDPTGLDISLKCKGGQGDCDKARDQLNGREHAQFKAGLDKHNKLTAHVSKADYAGLSKSEKALYNAINNPNKHATINAVGNTGQSEFGVHNKSGVNTVDLENMSKLDAPSNKGGLNSGDAMAHEAMDAYYSLSHDALSADQMAAGLFPGLGPPTGQSFGNFEEIAGEVMTQPITDGRGSERQTIILNTPIPRADLQGKTDAQKDKMFVDAGSRVQGVTFEKPKH